MELISIIIPIYNVEKYIHRCVDSVINQTYKNLEIILVDDGSPDNCGNICDEYAKQDSRIKVIHKENGGLSDARNFGIEAAQGEWLFFIDSDDWLHSQTIEKLYQAAIENDVSVSMCSYLKTEGDSPKVDILAKSEIWSPKSLYLKAHVKSTVAWAKLYKKNCFANIRYPIGKLHEDEFVTYKILFSQDKVAFVDQPYYAYFINSEGITKSDWNPKRVAVLDAKEEQLSFFEKLADYELIEFVQKIYLFDLVYHHKKAQSLSYNKECRQIKRKVKNLLLKKPELYFTPDNIWVLEHFFPRFMRIYSLVKGAIGKILKR